MNLSDRKQIERAVMADTGRECIYGVHQPCYHPDCLESDYEKKASLAMLAESIDEYTNEYARLAFLTQKLGKLIYGDSEYAEPPKLADLVGRVEADVILNGYPLLTDVPDGLIGKNSDGEPLYEYVGAVSNTKYNNGVVIEWHTNISRLFGRCLYVQNYNRGTK